MADASPSPGPPGTPPRPDREDRSTRLLFAAFVLASVVAIVLSGLAVMSLLREPSVAADRASGPVVTPSPSPAPSRASTPRAPRNARPKVDGAFRFLERVGGGPVRWNPCQTITYAVNAREASSPVQPDLKVALRRVTRATGIAFRSVGTTRASFFHTYLRMRYQGVIGRAELVLIWVDHDDYEAILRRLHDPRPSIAFAKTMAGLRANQDQYFGGIIVMDGDATARRGFGFRYAHGAVLLHELGHIMGLDHVKDPDQLMYSGRHPDFSISDFGVGDLEGLRRLGQEAGCLD
jgi:Matrixin